MCAVPVLQVLHEGDSVWGEGGVLSAGVSPHQSERGDGQGGGGSHHLRCPALQLSGSVHLLDGFTAGQRGVQGAECQNTTAGTYVAQSQVCCGCQPLMCVVTSCE